ncbi:MAG: signal peptidase I [Candidatus Coproplasma sp.]
MAEKKKETTVKRALSIVCTVISALIFVLVALLLINMIICRTQNKPVNFFGYSFSVVQTNSMEDEIMTGDLIVFKKVDYSSLKVGDNIVFRADENFKDANGQSIAGYTIVHKIIEVTENGLVTKGVNNFKADDGFRAEADIYGLCVANSAVWGKIFSFLGKYGVLIIIFIIAVPVIVTQTIKIVKLSKQKNKEGAEGENQEPQNEGQTLKVDNQTPIDDNKSPSDETQTAFDDNQNNGEN